MSKTEVIVKQGSSVESFVERVIAAVLPDDSDRPGGHATGKVASLQGAGSATPKAITIVEIVKRLDESRLKWWQYK
ncbi:hypothetical protein SAICODRAFT_31451 [Saitoella complicata NRRL Y-17804]|uniref:uncharacterized protein n=1 Tax=Saitoella complicata (strain BCRC 22490 / CBS 7301 / JCM 7358 / NBRC 10748 / NRRL Y-17804) TaxID=698492 RepID=UPI00086818DD|nr:uncharacterized protein SAICODRAFT_31451 [Saitoella complicata NRRL Y-17804]ODQ51247.1 hypothetical protein SAICODRAFT_31451 [Saitoella complicata NRRL Y-17804]